MAWNLTADFTETCSCNMLCPCWYGVKELMVMDQGWCASAWLLRVHQGNADGLDLGGRALAAAANRHNARRQIVHPCRSPVVRTRTRLRTQFLTRRPRH